MSKSSFIFIEEPEFSAQVDVVYPGVDGPVHGSFIAKFALVPEDEVLQVGADKPETLALAIEQDRAFLTGILRGWSGISMEGGGEMQFTPENVTSLLSFMHVRKALGTAYSRAVFDSAEKRVGNSAQPQG